MEKPGGWFLLMGCVCGSQFLGKNAGRQTVYLPGMMLFRGVCPRILLVETGYKVSLYISNFIFYFVYNFTISFNFIVILTYF